MKKIKLFEQVIADPNLNLQELEINPTMFCAYRSSKTVENECIDFNEVIWDNDVKEIAKCLIENRIYEFTISSNFSGLVSTLAAFEKLGFHICGTTEVNAPYKDFMSKDYAKIPAIRMRG